MDREEGLRRRREIYKIASEAETQGKKAKEELLIHEVSKGCYRH